MKNFTKIILTIVCGLVASHNAISQVTFEKRFLPNYSVGFNGIIELNDHTFMASGYGVDTTIFDFSNTRNNIIAKFDTSANVLWLKCWGGINNEQPNAFRKVTENGSDYFLQLGISNSFYKMPPQSQSDPNDLYFIKYDTNGDTLWTRVYGPTSTYPYLTLSTDSNYIIGQGTSLIKVNQSDGDTIWTRNFDLSGSPIIGFSSVSNTLDNGYYLAGSAITTFAADYSLLKTDSLGNLNWCYVYGDTAANRSWAVTTTLDGGAIIIGESSFLDSSDVLVIRTNSFGDTMWCRAFDYNNSKDIGRGVLLTPDNGCVINGVGIKQAPIGLTGKYYLFKLDSLGNILWSNTYTGGFGNVSETFDGGFVGTNATMVKTDSLGNSCTAQTISLTTKSFPLTIMPVFPNVGSGLNKCKTTNSKQSILANPFNEVDNCVWAGEHTQTLATTNFSIYPNPVLTQLAISIPIGVETQLVIGQTVTVTIYDVMGKQKQQQKLTNNDGKLNLDVSGLASGIYFLQVKQGDKVYNGKFVKE